MLYVIHWFMYNSTCVESIECPLVFDRSLLCLPDVQMLFHLLIAFPLWKKMLQVIKMRTTSQIPCHLLSTSSHPLQQTTSHLYILLSTQIDNRPSQTPKIRLSHRVPKSHHSIESTTLGEQTPSNTSLQDPLRRNRLRSLIVWPTT